MNENLNTSPELFYDPFAEDDEVNFDPVTAHTELWERYENKEIEHDYAADNFLADTQALMMDAQFLGRYAEVEMIAARMHTLCGEDHMLEQTMQNNETFSDYFKLFDHHEDGNHAEHDHKDEEESEIDPKTGKKKKKNKYRRL